MRLVSRKITGCSRGSNRTLTDILAPQKDDFYVSCISVSFALIPN